MATDPVCLMIVDEEDAEIHQYVQETRNITSAATGAKNSSMRTRSDIRGFVSMSVLT